MHFSPDEFFHMHTVLISMSTKQSFSPALPSRILDVLWRWPWKDQRNGMKRNRIPVLFRFFGWWELLPWQKELCWVTAAPLCSSPLHLQMGKGRVEGTMGEQQICLAHKPLTNGDAKNHTQQQCGITQTIWENRWFKAIHAPFQRDIQMWQNCHSENIFDRSTFCWFGERVSPVTVSNVNTIHTKPTRLSVSCGPLWNWPYFYVLCPQGATNNNTIKLNKYNPNDSQGQ